MVPRGPLPPLILVDRAGRDGPDTPCRPRAQRRRSRPPPSLLVVVESSDSSAYNSCDSGSSSDDDAPSRYEHDHSHEELQHHELLIELNALKIALNKKLTNNRLHEIEKRLEELEKLDLREILKATQDHDPDQRARKLLEEVKQWNEAAIRHNKGVPFKLEDREEQNSVDDVKFLKPEGMEDAIVRRNEAFRVLVQTAKLISQRIQETQDRIIKIKKGLDDRTDKNVDELVAKLNKLVGVLQNHADQANDPFRMSDFLGKIKAMVATMTQKATNSNGTPDAPKQPILSSEPKPVEPIRASLSDAEDFHVAPTGDNANGSTEEEKDTTDFFKNKWDGAIRGRNENFQNLVEIVRLLMIQARVLKQNYEEVQLKVVADDQAPNALDELRKLLNQLVTTLSSQDDDNSTVNSLRAAIANLKTDVDQNVQPLDTSKVRVETSQRVPPKKKEDDSKAPKATGDTKAKKKDPEVTRSFASLESDSSLSDHVIANGESGLHDASNTGINPPKEDQKLDVPSETEGKSFAVKKWVDAIKQRNLNFVVLVDAVYELIDIVSTISSGVTRIENITKVERDMHSSTKDLISELYQVYTELANHTNVPKDGVANKNWDPTKDMNTLYTRAVQQLPEPRVEEPKPEGETKKDPAKRKGGGGAKPAKREQNEEEQPDTPGRGSGSAVSSGSSLSDRTAELSERVVRLEAKTRAAASELLQSNPSGVPVARSSLGSRSGHSRNGKNYKLNLAF